MNFCGATDIGKCRSENQDAFAADVIEDGSVWLVLCDGMGGMQHGSLASTRTVSLIEKRLRAHLPQTVEADRIRNLLLKAINDSNKDILKTGIKMNVAGSMGTTVVAAVVRGRTAYIAHAGDSRAYILRPFSIKQITRDHSVVQQLVDSGNITAEEAKNHPRKNIITSALGIEEMPEIDYNVISLKKNDILLICSDGLTNMISDRAIMKTVRASRFEKAADALIKKALDAGGADNVTAVLAKID